MDTWLDDLKEEDIAYFAASEKGWSSNAYYNGTRSPYTARRQQRWLCSMVLGRLKREEEVLSLC
jgi:hypothetical protein